MFCTKCGYNAGTAKFCPKCGTPLAAPQNVQAETTKPVETPVQPVQETPVQPVQETPVQPVQETPVQETPVEPVQETPVEPVQETPVQPVQETPVQPQFGYQQPQFGAGQPQFGYNAAAPGYQEAPQGVPVPKKKKKWPIVAAIVAAVAVVAAVLLVIFLPKLKSNSEDKHAIEAVKKVGASLEDSVDKLFNNLSTTSVSDKTEFSGTFKFDSVSVDGEDYTKYVKADTLYYDVQVDTLSDKAAGELKLQNGSTSLLTVSFYTDGTTVYFKVPELFSESFSMSVAQLAKDSDISYYSDFSDISGYLSMFSGTGDVEQYKEPAKAAARALAKGIDAFAENCQYDKNDSLTYNSQNGDIKVKEYSVTVNEAAVKAACDAAIDALYADSATSSYMSMLSIAGYTQDSLKSTIADSIKGMTPVKFSMYVDDDDDIVRVAMNLSDIDSTTSGTFSVAFIGDKNPSDYVVVEAEADDATLKYTIQNRDNNSAVAFEMKQGTEYLNMGLDCSLSGNTVTINDLSMNMLADGVKADFKVTGDYSQKEFSSMKYTSSNFSNPVNVYNMTSAQQTALSMELVQNANVFSKILGDDLYKQMFGSLTSTTITPTNGGTTGTGTTGTGTTGAAGTTTTTGTVDSSLVGTWTETIGTSTTILTINADGKGTIASDGTTVNATYAAKDGKLTITMEYMGAVSDPTEYTYTISGKTLTLTSDGYSDIFTKN